jgi:hypothetical protein
MDPRDPAHDLLHVAHAHRGIQAAAGDVADGDHDASVK